jgi:hypothetical protein
MGSVEIDSIPREIERPAISTIPLSPVKADALYKSLAFYLALGVLVVALWEATVYISSLLHYATATTDASKALDVYADEANNLTSLATGVLAGLGWFFTRTSNQSYKAREVWPALATAVCACLSVFFGFVLSQNLAFAHEFSVDPYDGAQLGLSLPRYFQFYGLLLSVFFFAELVRRNWRRVE